MIDSVGGWVNMMSAVLARIRFARSYLMMFRHLAAGVAENTVRVQVVFEPFKASVVGWKLVLEILERVSDHLRALNFGFAHRSPPLSHTVTMRSLTDGVPTVKG